MDFCTLGMCILDDIHFPGPQAPALNVLGGGGTYAALGARIVSPPPLSRRIGWIVDAGSDFPDAVRTTIASWGTQCLLRETPGRLTTRGWNGYVEGGNEKREFRYLTSKLRIDGESLDGALLRARSFHAICSAQRCGDMLETVKKRRQSEGAGQLTRPLWIWEPIPDLCIPEELDRCYQTLQLVDVISPNHGELCGYFGVEAEQRDGSTNKEGVEASCKKLLERGIGSDGRGSVVVRAGKDGCYVATREQSAWLPAYHQVSKRVVDPTGGGNAFLGAMAVSLARLADSETTDFHKICEAAVAGAIGASYAIEQIGMPSLETDPDGRESWNGESAEMRLASFQARLRRSNR